MAGRLEKLTNAAFEEGVVGWHCAEYEQPPAPPSPPDLPEPPPGLPVPPEVTPPPCTCPPMKTIYYRRDNIVNAGNCFATRIPIDPNINGWPVCCSPMSWVVPCEEGGL